MHTLQAIDWKQHHIQKSSSLTSTWHHAKEPKATRVLLSQLSSLLVRDGTEGASGQAFRMPRPPATKPCWPSETVTAEQVGWGISGKLAISNSASSLRAQKGTSYLSYSLQTVRRKKESTSSTTILSCVLYTSQILNQRSFISLSSSLPKSPVLPMLKTAVILQPKPITQLPNTWCVTWKLDSVLTAAA